MLVSIVIRTYSGREPLLLRALNSLAAQETSSSFEAVVVVDGVRALDSIKVDIAQFGFAKLHHPGRQMGRSEAANLGLERSVGDVINFLDDDDWLLPNHIEVLSSALQAREDAEAAYSAAWELQATTDVSNPSLGTYGDRRKFFFPNASSLDLLDRNLFPIQAVMFRRSAIERGARMAPELDALEDWLFWQTALLGRPLVSVNAITSTYLVPMLPSAVRARLVQHEEAMPKFTELQRGLKVPLSSLVEAIARRGRPHARAGHTAQSGDVHPLIATLARRRRQLASSKQRSLVQNIELHTLTVGRDVMLGPIMKAAPAVRRSLAPLRAAMAPRGDRRDRSAFRLQPPNATLFYSADVPAAQEPVRGRDIIFTACNWRYMDKALTLAASCRRHMPNHDFHVLLVDGAEVPEGLSQAALAGITIFPISRLPIMSQAWSFTHSIVELSTAVKPAYALHLLDGDAKSVTYLDPDTLLLSPLTSVAEGLLSSDVVLTPHLFKPAKTRETIEAFEISAMAHGIYNLGFFACRNTPAGREVVSYWNDRCEQYCFSDVPRGIFTDQKWFDHVPVFFKGIKVLEHPTVNAAVWNMEGRTLTFSNGGYAVDGKTLEMFHFSGWDKGVPDHFAAKTLSGRAGKRLIAQYTEMLEARAVDAEATIWRYGHYADGAPITQAQRTCYRRNSDLQEAFTDPYAVGERTYRDWILSEGLGTIEDQYDESAWVMRYY